MRELKRKSLEFFFGNFTDSPQEILWWEFMIGWLELADVS